MKVNFEGLTQSERDAVICIISSGYKLSLEGNGESYKSDELTEENRETFISSNMTLTNVFFKLLASVSLAEVVDDENNC